MYTFDTSKDDRKTSGEQRSYTYSTASKRVPQFDAANLEVSKVYNLILNFGLRWQASGKSLLIRIYFIIFFFISIFLAINLKLAFISTSTIFTNTALNKNISYRKDVVDRNGALVATTLPIYSLFANPDKMFDKKQAIEKLSKVITIKNKTKILNELNSGKNFVWIKHDLTPSDEQAINNLGIPGIGFEKSFKRMYAYGNLLSHAVGYVSRDNSGLAGIERFFDDDLLLAQDSYIPNEVDKDNHKPLELSLDVRIQNIVSDELDRAIEEFNAIGGVGVVVDPNNGEILSLVSKPDFNPHNPGVAKPEELFNKASLGSYEFGSVFKILTLAIGLETKTITLNQRYDISNLKVGKFNIKDFTHTQGIHTVAEIFAKSSNKGTAKIALDIGRTDFQKYLRKLKLDNKVITEIAEKTYPSFPAAKEWSDISMVTISYGYGVSTSVLNLVQATIPTINGGILYPLTLVKKNTEPKGERIFSEQTSENIRKLLRMGIKEGTGKKADVAGYLVGGKSGTANKLIGKTYAKNNNRISSFMSIFPSIKAKYLVYVMLDNPQPTKDTHGIATGAVNSAPTAGRIIARIASLTGMLPYDINDPEIQKKMTIPKTNGV
jgi:cell division protein FtsI (penicillin-binding protein 3)